MLTSQFKNKLINGFSKRAASNCPQIGKMRLASTEVGGTVDKA